MANDWKKKLIKLYATNNTEILEESAGAFKQALGGNYKAILREDEYKALKQTIKEEKEQLESCEARYKKKNGVILGDPKAQAIECLSLLLFKAIFNSDNKQRFEQKFECLRELMEAKYGSGWDKIPALRAHFDFLYPKIRDWNLFFFSYANDDPIIEGLGIDLSTEFWRSNSTLAELIIQYLKRNGLPKYFYDKRDVETGERLQKIFDECAKSFFFIQLVSKDSLVFDRNNWSFREYTKFKEFNKELQAKHPQYSEILEERFLFAIPGGKVADVKPGGYLPPVYEDWYEHIDTETHYKTLPNDKVKLENKVKEIATSIRKFLDGSWIPGGV